MSGNPDAFPAKEPDNLIKYKAFALTEAFYVPFYIIIKTYIMKVDFHNCYTHFVFTTYGRIPLIDEEHRDRIEKYITGIVTNQHSRMYAIWVNPEHAHFLVSRSPKISEERLATIIADSSQLFINNNKLTRTSFAWQETCGAFSVSKSAVDSVCRYILNQAEHHKKVTFAQEYEQMMSHYLKGSRWDVM